jgi:oligopeptide transport system substrate-binding protein
MNEEPAAAKNLKKTQSKNRAFFVVFCVFLWLFTSSCADIQKPRIDQFYGEVKLPQKKQEFRWSNGKLPKQIDPALAAAPPETDLVRAVYEGLTDIDAKTLEVKPAVAESWEISDDGRTWTFHLRKDAKWTNGETVTARDFVRSWRRLAEMGMDVPNSKLLKNIVGAENFAIDDGISILPPEEFDEEGKEEKAPANDPQKDPINNAANKAVNKPAENARPANPADPANSANPLSADAATPAPEKAEKTEKNGKFEKKEAQKTSVQKWLGVEAENDQTLRVWLIQPDRNFAAVAANPLFSPVYESADPKNAVDLGKLENAAMAVTNGAFKIASVSKDEVALSRSDSFWGRERIGLESVRMIAKPDAESALAAYQANEVDAVTNTNFEPLALKLLQPYDDFRRTTHNALTFYQFNLKQYPFDDTRVRRALAMSIQREPIVQDEMDGAGEPALNYLPFAENEKGKVKESFDEAKKLLAEAGFPAGEFPRIRLLINRNDLQRRIAANIAMRWKKNLNIETEVIVKDRAEYEEAIKKGDYDLVRRGVVMPTTNETSSLLAMFDPVTNEIPAMRKYAGILPEERPNDETGAPPPAAPGDVPQKSKAETKEEALKKEEDIVTGKNDKTEIILTEKRALELIPAIPLYFPVSNSLVKPYVSGFDTNLLDAPSLKTVVINGDWKNSQTQK